MGENALKLGAPFEDGDMYTTLLDVKRLTGPDQPPTRVSGQQHYGILVEICNRSQVEEGYSTNPGLWSFHTSDGYKYEGVNSTWPGWPSPQYPNDEGTRPGQCHKGWMSIEADRPLDLALVGVADEGGTEYAQWKVNRKY